MYNWVDMSKKTNLNILESSKPVIEESEEMTNVLTKVITNENRRI